MNKPESLAEDQRSAASAWPTVPVGPAAGGAPRSMRLSAGHASRLLRFQCVYVYANVLR